MSIKCTEYRAHASGALQGFANFEVPKMGIQLFGCSVFMKDGKRWLSLPSREYTDPQTNEKKFISIMRFIEKSHNDAFCQAALHALDEYCKAQAAPEPEPQAFAVSDDQVPF